MSPENIIKIENQISSLMESIKDIQKSINGLKLNERNYLTSNTPIPPGIGCKFAYDSKGLILKSCKLDISDIPELQIENIKGLRDILNNTITMTEFERLQIQSNNNILKRSNEIYGTGTKINYDKNGFVISSSDIEVNDIPLLPISKIDGLNEKLELIQSSIKLNNNINESFSVNSGIGCKISYDEKGRVIASQSLSIEDIPNEIISRLNILESKIPSLVSQHTIDGLLSTVNKKIDGNDKIIPGTFTKVNVDSKGLVTFGDKLSKEDLPDLNIEDINELEALLRSKANQNDIVSLNESINSIISSLPKLVDINTLQNSLKGKAEMIEIIKLSNSIKSLKETVDSFIIKTHYDTIEDQFKNIQLELSSLEGRISILEVKLGLHSLEEK